MILRRSAVAIAVALLAASGCAAVLGIEDIPVPDAVDGGVQLSPPDSKAPASDAPFSDAAATDTGIGDSAAPEDALPNDSSDLDADAGEDAGYTVIVIDGPAGFDPSAVCWSEVDNDLLYIADDGPTEAGLDSGTIWGWTEATGLARIATVPLPSKGERFGQLARLSDVKLMIPEFTSSSGHLFIYELNSQTLDGPYLTGDALLGGAERGRYGRLRQRPPQRRREGRGGRGRHRPSRLTPGGDP